MEHKHYAIGIDLGTETTCTSVYRNDTIEIIPHEGHRSMPSWIAFTDSGRLVGAAAKSQAGRNPRNTIFQSDMKIWPFSVLKKGRGVAIGVDYKGQRKILTPVEVLSMILGKAKDDAERYLEGRVRVVIVSVPCYFNSSQRLAIRDAAHIAELDVLDLINGPPLPAWTTRFPTRTMEQGIF